MNNIRFICPKVQNCTECVCKIYLRENIYSLGFACDLAGKESACNEGDLGLIPGLGRSSGEGKAYPLQYSDLENSMDCRLTISLCVISVLL